MNQECANMRCAANGHLISMGAVDGGVCGDQSLWQLILSEMAEREL